ncbi:RHS repeat-associated core domain-containing protein [Photorhabdus sp. JAR]|nr:RHS repeat-associated core domain-containing protein [Photorhabdus luminescens]MCW7764618.1 RHS repeat-associated core domain-containing protein [Photorhabdus luminescens subsp. venezuelensis]
MRFAGQYEDPESGLFYNRHRYYESETGQYLSPDPLNLAGGVNPYSYVHNPANWIDPLGLAGENCGKLFSSESYTEIEKAKLDGWIVDSFKDGKYKTVVTTQDTYVYRVYGGNAKPGGSFVSDLPTSNRIQAKIDAALLPEWKNTREFEAQILVPRGTTLHVGQVAPQTTKSGAVLKGEATQILLPRDWDQSWIKNMKSIPSK